MTPKIQWPDGKKFAFTVFDDTDRATTENVSPVYAYLADLGFRTTKTVWPITGPDKPMVVGGATCDDPGYLKWHLELQKLGFEIGWHNATFHSSRRDETIRGLEKFNEFFGQYPKTMANHTICEEGIYWGPNRLSGIYRTIYNVLNRNRAKDRYRGHIEGDPFFWGDLCKKHIRYCRNFVFSDINTLKACPLMPYYDPQRPFVNAWYASSEGTRMEPFNETLCEANQDQLEAEGGACIMYTHFAKEFFVHGQLNSRFKELMKRLSQKGGWFVPTSTLLDYIAKAKGVHTLSDKERSALERKWLIHKLRVGTT